MKITLQSGGQLARGNQKPQDEETAEYEFEPSPHLSEGSIVDYELRTALALRVAMEDGLRKLKKKTSKDNVHKSRVSLRRWFSVWSVMQEEGWDSDEFAKNQIKPLKKLLKAMGALRDMDVCIEKAKSIECSDDLLKKLKRNRKKRERELTDLIDNLSPLGITEEIGVYLHKRAASLTKVSRARPYEVLDEHVRIQEEKVKKIALKAADPEALHKVRLGIKKWRYLLTECMGLTNLELVNAQTVLGEMHDLDRLELIIKENNEAEKVFKALRAARGDLFREWMRCREKLPYGLRPGISHPKA